MRAFVQLRTVLATHTDILRRLDTLEEEQRSQGGKIEAVFDAIRNMIEAPPALPPKRPMGFIPDKT
jgi:hypothetical protein